MSFRKRTVILSPQAQADLTDIRAYTLEHWGETQRDRYEAALLGRIASLADFPATGVGCPRFFPGCRARRAGSHVP